MIRKMNEKCEIPEDAAVPNPHLAEIVKLSDALIAKGMDGNEVLKMVPADYQSMPVDGLLKVIGALKEKLK
jgi:hypothetical protein